MGYCMSLITFNFSSLKNYLSTLGFFIEEQYTSKFMWICGV